MRKMNAFLATDGYKTGHHIMYPEGTIEVYDNLTPRSFKYAINNVEYVIAVGQKMAVTEINDMFNETFFRHEDVERLAFHLFRQGLPEQKAKETARNKIKAEVCSEIKKEFSLYLDMKYDVSHIERLWDLGYLPVKIKALPEGVKVPIKVPVLTIVNTLPDFFWLPNFLETIISNLLWKPMTSATIAYEFKKTLTKWAMKTDSKNVSIVEFQAHDFSMRGMDSIYAAASSGLGHASSFLGSDTIPVIHAARYYYGDQGPIIHSVNATEHSVMCAGEKDSEIETFRRLLRLFPTGILSVVSDTWDLWKVIVKYLPELKDEILKRAGKLVIRPDSGNPVDIICGFDHNRFDTHEEAEKYYRTYGIKDPKYYVKNEFFTVISHSGNNFKYADLEETPADKGVVQLLWEIFGGQINEDGFKVLNEHIGAIYGDSINFERANQICERLASKGFATTNVVLGIGSFTYQYNTRDNHGFAVKATHITIQHPDGKMEERDIFKDPLTSVGTNKTSAKGFIQVLKENGEYIMRDQVSREQEENSLLTMIYLDGKVLSEDTLKSIRRNVNNELAVELGLYEVA